MNPLQNKTITNKHESSTKQKQTPNKHEPPTRQMGIKPNRT